MQHYMITHPRERDDIETVKLLQFFIDNDIKKWIIAKETGLMGYRHWQIRLATSLTFECLKAIFPKGHIEKCSDTWEYERKEGDYLSSEDTIEMLKVRYGTMTTGQLYVLERTAKQKDRQITVWYDKYGKCGKSWLSNYLVEKNIAFYVPPWIDSIKSIIQFVASGYDNQPLIIIDMPRTVKWSKALYIAIESMKDGLVCDARYSAKVRNIRGVKILVLTNTKPTLDKLSEDRWDIIDNVVDGLKV